METKQTDSFLWANEPLSSTFPIYIFLVSVCMDNITLYFHALEHLHKISRPI